MSTDQRPLPSSQEQARLQSALRESEILREFAELLASSLDLEHILRVLVKRTTQVCEVERCCVWLLEEARGILRPKTYHLQSTSLNRKQIDSADRLWYRSPLLMDDPLVHRLFAGQAMLSIPDLGAEPTMQRVAETFLVRSILLIPLMREGRPVGMLTLDDPGKSRAFTPEQLQLARAIGQQASIAIDNARLYQQARTDRRRAEQLIDRVQSIYEVALMVNAGEDTSSVFQVAMEHLARGLDAEGGMIALLEGQELRPAESALKGSEGRDAPGWLKPARLDCMPHCRLAADSGQPSFVTRDELENEERAWFSHAGFQNVIIVPLMAQPYTQKLAQDAVSRCVGLAFVNYRSAHSPPSRGQFAYAQDIAAQCALAVEKSQLLTEVRQAAAIATERANTLDAVFHAMTEGITVSDMQGNVLVLNNAASHFLGLPKNSRAHLLHFLRRYPVHTLDGQLISEEQFPLSRALRGERIRAERFVTRRADGEERILEVNIAPMFDGQEQQIGVVSAFRDVTESMRAEQRIRQALDTMLHVVEAVSGITDIKAILKSVLERTITTLNCQRGAVFLLNEDAQTFEPLHMLGFSEESLRQWNEAQRIWLDSTASSSHAFLQQLLDGHAALIDAEQCPQQPNPLSHIMILTAPIKQHNRVHGLLALDRSDYESVEKGEAERHEFGIWDIAVLEGIAQLAGLAVEQARLQQEAIEARASEAALREANALKDDFLAITAHEFRSPLTIILAQSQLVTRILSRLSKQLEDNEAIVKATKNLSIVEEQTRQLTDIVKTFLEVTHINKGLLALELDEVNLTDIVRQVGEHYKNASELHDIHCDIALVEPSCMVNGDAARLQQIIANLVENAIKYSPLGGPITIHLRRIFSAAGQSRVEVCVEDRGIGVQPAYQPRLFERFYRAPNSLDSKTKGIGLGLYIVAQLLHMQGGDIRVESSGVLGEGSRFIFTLPALES
jgi:PAS domain S-box-containing protein